ncbi:putative NDUFAF3/Mth938 domain-containing protein [Helianthus annuus]|nr:putative NDUFAF3/Mth938 domain-containing protein [Helianthus annuus]
MAVRQRAVATLPTLMRALRKESPSIPQRLPSLRRGFSLYDQVNLIDNVPEDQLRFQGYTDSGFTVNGVEYEGSLLCVGNLLLSWTPKKMSDITIDRYVYFICYLISYLLNHLNYPIPFNCMSVSIWCSLSIFQAVRPIPEILILGTGRYIQPVDPEIRKFIRSTGMKLEAIDSRNASSTYNILNEEGRIVAAALLPYGVSS